MGAQYSRCGRTNVLYSIMKELVDIYVFEVTLQSTQNLISFISNFVTL